MVKYLLNQAPPQESDLLLTAPEECQGLRVLLPKCFSVSDRQLPESDQGGYLFGVTLLEQQSLLVFLQFLLASFPGLLGGITTLSLLVSCLLDRRQGLGRCRQARSIHFLEYLKVVIEKDLKFLLELPRAELELSQRVHQSTIDLTQSESLFSLLEVQKLPTLFVDLRINVGSGSLEFFLQSVTVLASIGTFLPLFDSIQQLLEFAFFEFMFRRHYFLREDQHDLIGKPVQDVVLAHKVGIHPEDAAVLRNLTLVFDFQLLHLKLYRSTASGRLLPLVLNAVVGVFGVVTYLDSTVLNGWKLTCVCRGSFPQWIFLYIDLATSLKAYQTLAWLRVFIQIKIRLFIQANFSPSYFVTTL